MMTVEEATEIYHAKKDDKKLNQTEIFANALIFIRDLAEEELLLARVGTGAEVALRHILRKANEALSH